MPPTRNSPSAEPPAVHTPFYIHTWMVLRDKFFPNEQKSAQHRDAETQTEDESFEKSPSPGKSWIRRDDRDTILAIPDEAFQKLLLQRLDPSNTLSLSDCKIIRRTEGSYNHCAILKLSDRGYFVIKVPFTGTQAKWTPEDAHNFRSEAHTMNYIRRHTGVPVPEVLFADDTLNNVLQAPYILMRAIAGKEAYMIWWGKNSDGSYDYNTANCPSGKCIALRKNFLESLAKTMAKLSTLSFDKMGMLNFDEEGNNPQVGHYFEDDGTGTLKRREAFESSADYFEAKVDKWLSMAEEPIEDIVYGGSGLIGMVYKTPPFTASKARDTDQKESFVLRHNDLDLQNIFVDDAGNVLKSETPEKHETKQLSIHLS